MSNLKDGGPAFPIPMNPGETYKSHAVCDGMTLRDYFAAKAMQALLSRDNTSAFGTDHQENNKVCANVSYILADAMLEARGE